MNERLTATLTLRNLTPLEAATLELLPPELRVIDYPKPDPDWIWVVENGTGPMALLMGCYVSGICFFFRILTTAQANRNINWFLAAFPKILENARQRGCVAYGAFFRDSRPEEVKLARLMARDGGILESFTGTLGVVPLLPPGVDPSCLNSVLSRLSNS